MKMGITCKQAVDYISKKEEKKLNAWQRLQLWQHIATCSLCRLFASQNKSIVKALSGHKNDEVHHLPEEKKQEIIETVLKN